MEDTQDVTNNEEDVLDSFDDLDMSMSSLADDTSVSKEGQTKETNHSEVEQTSTADEKTSSDSYEEEIDDPTLTAGEKGLEKIKAIERKYLQELDDFYKPLIVKPKASKDATLVFLNPNEFYKSLLNLEKTSAQQLNKNLNMFLSEKDVKTQQVARNRTIASFWNFCEQMLGDHKNKTFTLEVKYFLRYSLIASSMVPKQVLSVIGHIDIEADPPKGDATVYYVDEWLQLVSKGEVSQSIVNEAELSEEAQEGMFKQRLNRMMKQRTDQVSKAQKINEEISKVQSMIRGKLEEIESIRMDTPYGFPAPYTPRDLEKFKAIHELVHSVVQKNTQLEVQYNGVVTNDKNIEKLKAELAQIEANKKESSDDEATTMRSRVVVSELQAIRQMHKLCIGRRGNHFPILYSNYFSSSLQQMGYRERVLQVLRQIEFVDYTLFQRTIKGNMSRSFPLIILVPCYGHHGFCWEPFEKYQRNTSAAKLVIPMYPRDLYVAMVNALGDFRWQLAKELAGQMWMEEGLTGWYFQWFDSNVKKGDVKEKFIEDYSLWMRWEQVGIQKVDKEVREIFWRFIPFNRKIKDKLVTMSPVYTELYKKEKNRHMSDYL